MTKYRLRESIPNNVSEALSIYPEILRDLFFSRGITDTKKAEEFIYPSYELHTHDPFLIAGMEKATSRILKAIENNERIVIWSDYDHDGIPGGVILHDFFKKIGFENFLNYIPHRHAEGYGVNEQGVETLFKDKVTLMITVDVGITDVEPISCAQDLGIDVIITDHHLPGEKLPKAYVILNSKQNHCDYPDDMLCGAALSWKLVVALITRGNFVSKIPAGFEKWLLDLVGISTIADMVPLLKENRVLAHYGLKVLRKTRRPGLLKLFRKIGIKPHFVSEDDIGFSVAPRINAASRMDNPYLAFELLSSTDEIRTEELASELHKLNDVRKGTVASMVKEMKHTLLKRKLIRSVIVMGNPHWQPALLGLAAMNLVEEHDRPVFLWGKEGGGLLKGSCRSDGSVNLVSLMQSVKEGVLLGFGGHAFSGGFSVNSDEVHFLEDHLNEAYERVDKTEMDKEILIDRKLQLDDISFKLWDSLSFLSPFGVGNPKPLFLFENVTPEKVRNFGKKNEHLEITFRKTNGDFVRAIEFFSNREIKENEKINLVATLEKSTFGRYPELRLRIVDII